MMDVVWFDHTFVSCFTDEMNSRGWWSVLQRQSWFRNHVLRLEDRKSFSTEELSSSGPQFLCWQVSRKNGATFSIAPTPGPAGGRGHSILVTAGSASGSGGSGGGGMAADEWILMRIEA